GDIHVSSIGQNVGKSGADNVVLNSSGDVTVVGEIDQSAATGALENIAINASGDINVGSAIMQLGGASATAQMVAGGTISLSNVTQEASNNVSLSLSATGAGDVDVAGITQGVSNSSAYI